MTSGAASFTGPLFVVGAPRSGTKLLRDLLNQHPRIGIPVAETHFIPGLVRRHGNPPRLEAAGGLEGLHREIRDTAFSWHMRRFGQEMPLERLEAVEDRSSWAAILEAVLRFYAPGGKAPGFIFGDKTPSYLSHLRLLKEVFPPAR
ncbi:MAG: sulfotransferase, partial [Planctomycetes bacterium]|nr:sulfotransferase [Planctomycetota bacterium]